MKTALLKYLSRLAFLLLLSSPSSHAKGVEWKGTIKGEEVEVSIQEGEFVKADHQLGVEEGHITTVDGYEGHFSQPDNFGKMPPHIKSWTVRWGGKDIVLPKGIYTSVFHPKLKSVEERFDDARLNNAVWIGESDDGESLLVIMMCGQDAQHVRLAFTIPKDGKAHRFTVEVIS